MLDTLSFSVNAILPLVLLILLGYGVRRLGFFSEDALKQLNRFNFRVPFCALMFVNIYNMDLSRGIPVPVRLVGLVVLAIVILTVLGLVFAQVLTKERARKGVLVQAMFRSNSAIIGLPLSESVAGAAGLATATVFQLPVVIYFNAMSVVMLSLYSRSEEKPKAGKVFAGVLKNPLIQGLLAGALA
ncbi:MAG: AEC family transporter, partial [Lachnospiraceae bacterium]|nr:AEC family transporter [Lachnospiraceae bacterium]